jgi:16S rRNA C1402 (ribose-2'-O) methylase RsmI
MTVVNQVQQTLAGLKSAQASFEGFALETDNQQAKQMYQQAAQQTQQIVDQVKQRVQEIQQEEPQYNQNQ